MKSPISRSPNRAIVFSPHPDDSEIGAAALVRCLSDLGWEIYIVVMTSEREPRVAATRRKEMLAAAKQVGVEPSHVRFAEFEDGGLDGATPRVEPNGRPVGRPAGKHKRAGKVKKGKAHKRKQAARLQRPALRATGTEMARLRKLIDKIGGAFDLVVVNHRSERHTDHRATSALVENIFSDQPTLEYIVGNYIDFTEFTPNFFVEIDDRLASVRGKAMAAHASQVKAGRILLDVYDVVHRTFAEEAGLDRAEPFQARSFTQATHRLLGDLNASRFERLWLDIASKEIHVFPGASPHVPYQDALAELRFELSRRSELPTFHPHPAGEATWVSRNPLAAGDVLIVGGPENNALAARYVNHMEDIRFRVTFSEPHPLDRRVRDCETGRVLRPVVGHTIDGMNTVSVDYGVVTVRPNPYGPAGASLIAIAGTTDVGTAGLVELFRRPSADLLELVANGVASRGTQGLFVVEADSGRLTCQLLDVHSIRENIDGATG